MSDVPTLAAEADAIHAEYRRNFAGRSRYTRDLALLDRLLAQTRDLLGRAEQLPGAESELLPVLRQRAELYGTEREQIAQVQAGGPDEGVAHRTTSFTRLARQRYNRNFAGQNRLTRDLGLLVALAADQRRWLGELQAVARRHPAGWHGEDLAQMESNARLFEGEVAEIRKARADMDPMGKAQLQATLANQQFDSWRLHFQGRQRRGRRPNLLRRMIKSLEAIRDEMAAARDAGVREDFNLKNLDNVVGRVTAWNDELERIEVLRASAGPDEVAGALGEDANDWFSAFRKDFAGKPHKDLDLAGLGRICEALQEVALAMDEHHGTWRREFNLRNLDIVLENLKAYEREFERAREVQRPA